MVSDDEALSDEARKHAPGYWQPKWDLDSLSTQDRQIVLEAEPYTLTGLGRLHALIIAVRYAIGAGIPGAFAECGVWRGGSVLAIALTLEQLGVQDRDIYLYDTFEGMTPPDERDTSPIEGRALDMWKEAQEAGRPIWPEYFDPKRLTEEAVRENVLRSGYPAERFYFVRGRVQDTLPDQAPDALALLRLDTDWYDSTYAEMVHLYPRLSDGGVLIVDDYGHWRGARKAVDQYLSEAGKHPLLCRVDYTCRLAVKQ